MNWGAIALVENNQEFSWPAPRARQNIQAEFFRNPDFPDFLHRKCKLYENLEYLIKYQHETYTKLLGLREIGGIWNPWFLGNFEDYCINQDFIFTQESSSILFCIVSDSFENIVHPLSYNNTFLHPCSDSIGFSICCQYVSWSSCLIIYTFNHHR